MMDLNGREPSLGYAVERARVAPAAGPPCSACSPRLTPTQVVEPARPTALATTAESSAARANNAAAKCSDIEKRRIQNRGRTPCRRPVVSGGSAFISWRGNGSREELGRRRHATMASTPSPMTPANRKQRRWLRPMSRLCSISNRARIVACGLIESSSCEGRHETVNRPIVPLAAD